MGSAGNAGHSDIAKALVSEGLVCSPRSVVLPLCVVIAYGNVSVQDVEAMIQAGARPDVYACAAAGQLQDDSRREQLLALLGTADKAAVWLQEALSGSSREWV